MEYIRKVKKNRPDECFLCDIFRASDDRGNLVLRRTALSAILLNRYPYSSGHLMVAPLRHIPALGDLEPGEAAEIHALTVQAIAALSKLYAPDGFNVGWNLGAVAGGSIAAHLHQHVVPRWSGDTNFMPVLADVKVLPEHLESTRAGLIEAWV